MPESLSAKHQTRDDDPRRLAVFLSGSGRTLVNLQQKIDARELDAEIISVVASRPCLGIERAGELGLPTEVRSDPFTSETLLEHVKEHRIGLIVLAGYLSLLPIPPQLERRVLNIHPGLLPGDGTGGRFGGRGMYGKRVHQAVLDAGEQESGCTVHYCSAQYDAGPVILREACPVLPDDDPAALAARVFELELEAYPKALQLAIDEHRRKE